jgi:cytochrome c553
VIIMGVKFGSMLLAAAMTSQPLVTGASGSGQSLWMLHCRKCHGATGDGKTAMGRIFNIKNFTDPAIQADLTDDEIRTSILEGRTNESGTQIMLSFKDKMTPEEVEELIAHFRSLARD